MLDELHSEVSTLVGSRWRRGSSLQEECALVSYPASCCSTDCIVGLSPDLLRSLNIWTRSMPSSCCVSNPVGLPAAMRVENLTGSTLCSCSCCDERPTSGISEPGGRLGASLRWLCSCSGLLLPLVFVQVLIQPLIRSM